MITFVKEKQKRFHIFRIEKKCAIKHKYLIK